MPPIAKFDHQSRSTNGGEVTTPKAIPVGEAHNMAIVIDLRHDFFTFSTA